MKTRTAALTHEGFHASNNEDAFLDRPESGLFVVCDGMGGHDGGEIASEHRHPDHRAEHAPDPRCCLEWTVAEASER